MVDGGFKFEQSKSDEARAYLRLTLGKNPAFAKTPNGMYVLRTDAPKRAKKSGAPAQEIAEPAAEGGAT